MANNINIGMGCAPSNRICQRSTRDQAMVMLNLQNDKLDHILK